MQAEYSVKPPSNWSKYGEIYTNEKFQLLFICSICRETVHNFANIFVGYDVTSLWDHIDREHEERLRISVTFSDVNIPKESNSYVHSDNGSIKMESRNECEDSDIYKELNNEPLAKVIDSNICTMDSTVISIEDSDDEHDQQEHPQGISSPQGVEAPQQSHNPQKEILESLGLALLEAFNFNNTSASKSDESSVIQNCYTMITNYSRQAQRTQSIRLESHQAPTQTSKNTNENIHLEKNHRESNPAHKNQQENMPGQQNQRENIPPKQNRAKHKRIRKVVNSKSSKKVAILKKMCQAARQSTRIIKCNICGYRMSSELAYWKHNVELHTIGVNPINRRCSICLQLVLKEEFEQHKRQHSLQPIQHCILCPKFFTEHNRLLSHYVNYHTILHSDIPKQRNSYVPPPSI